MPEETKDMKDTPAQGTVPEQPAVSEDLARRIDCEFERYRKMRDAVRMNSGKLRRSLIVDHSN